jgi:hypothetical protein
VESAKVSTLRTRRRVKRLAIAIVISSALAAGAPAADAQDPGVVYEPGSPSDKEYAIPLEEARRDAGGERPGKIEALAFGIGLSRMRGGGGGAQSGGGKVGAPDRGGGGEQARAGRGPSATSRDFNKRLADAEDAGAPSLWRLGPLLLVLLPALLAGLLLARRERQRPAT